MSTPEANTGPHVLALEAIGQPVERGAGLGGAIQRVGEVRRLGHYPRLGVEPEADLDHVAFGDPAGGTAGCADADNEPVAHRRDPAVPGVTADRDDHLRPAAGPEGVDNRRRNLDPGVASGLDRG